MLGQTFRGREEGRGGDLPGVPKKQPPEYPLACRRGRYNRHVIPTLPLSTTLLIISSSSFQLSKPTLSNTDQNVHHILKMFASTILSTLAVLGLATTGVAAPQAGAATPKTGTAAATPQTGAGAAAAAVCTYQKINTLSVCTAEGLCSGNTGACPKANFPNGDAQDTSSKQLNLDICKGQPVGAKCQQTIACCP